MTVDLQTGATVDDLRRQLDALPEGDAFSVNPIEIVSPAVRHAVDAQSLGLWVLTGVSAIAAHRGARPTARTSGAHDVR